MENDNGTKKRSEIRKSKAGFPFRNIVFFTVSLIYLELIFHLMIFKEVDINLLYPIVFSLPLGALLALICSAFSKKTNYVLTVLCTVLLCLIFAAQKVYYSIFKAFLSFYSVTVGTGKVLEFWREALLGILKNTIPIILIFLPLILLIFYERKNLDFKKRPLKELTVIFLGGVLLYLVGLFTISTGDQELYSPYDLYFNNNVTALSMKSLGNITTSRLELKRLIFGFEDSELDNDLPVIGGEGPLDDDTPSYDTSPNVMNIDFNTLISQEKNKTIKELHEYFSMVEPTNKNQYTGMFEGYNLVFLTAEGFSPYAVHKEVTPTLYKLVNEGFVFNNFYNPIWGVSTSDGEYVASLGLIPKTGVWSFYKSAKNYLPFAMGNQFESLGYSTRAYHNHTYDYYRRDVSHPNMGYDYKGVGNGLVVKKTWPESDLEMMEVTVPEYINDEKFHTYYMTVSGHMNYSFTGNSMANKNKGLVENLPYSEEAKAYIACNIELDKALEYLIDCLEEAGVADKTVIALSADHYPYGLQKSTIDELAGHTVEENFELYKSNLIIWSGSMKKPVVIDKYCSSLDIIPTLSNLFGLEYDSRLLMGRDILSDSTPLVMFSDRSFITDKVMYNSNTGKIKSLNGEEVSADYIETYKKIINNKFIASQKVLESDYYKSAVPKK